MLSTRARDAFMDEAARIAALRLDAALDELEKLGLGKDREALREQLGLLLIGYTRSLLLAIDGGTQLADHGVLLRLTERDTSEPGDGLHEYVREAFEKLGIE